jgi:hypothetical protein
MRATKRGEKIPSFGPPSPRSRKIGAALTMRRRSSERIGGLREEKEALEGALADLGAEREEAEQEELMQQLERIRT